MLPLFIIKNVFNFYVCFFNWSSLGAILLTFWLYLEPFVLFQYLVSIAFIKSVVFCISHNQDSEWLKSLLDSLILTFKCWFCCISFMILYFQSSKNGLAKKEIKIKIQSTFQSQGLNLRYLTWVILTTNNINWRNW